MNNITSGSYLLVETLRNLEESISKFQQNEQTFDLSLRLYGAFLFVENAYLESQQILQLQELCPPKLTSKAKPKKAAAKPVSKKKVPVMAVKKVVKKVVAKPAKKVEKKKAAPVKKVVKKVVVSKSKKPVAVVKKAPKKVIKAKK